MKRDWKKHISTIIFAVFVLVILFVPAAKARLIESLMEIGLFKPNVHEDKKFINADLSAIKFKDVKGNVLSLADLKGKKRYSFYLCDVSNPKQVQATFNKITALGN